MAIVVEDGTMVDGANSYVSVATATAYALARGVTIDPTKVNIYLLRATDYLEALTYQGQQVAPTTQALSWPRTNYFDTKWQDYFPIDSIPPALVTAQCQLVMYQQAGLDISPISSGPLIKSESIGPISTTYATNNSDSGPSMPLVTSLLAPLLLNSGGAALRTVRI